MKNRNPFTNAELVRVNADSEEYHTQTVKRGDPKYVMTRSALMEFRECPHRWVSGFEDPGSKATEWGNLMDCLVLDAARFPDRYAVAPETYPGTPKKKGDPCVQKPWNSNADYCDAWESAQIGKTIVKAKDFAKAKLAVKFLHDDPRIGPYLRDSDRQVLVTADYVDEHTGLRIPVKALIDLVPSLDSEYRKSIGDLKTTESAHPRAWKRKVFDSGYHVQAAMYLDLYVAATGEDRTDFYHLIQESKWPHEPGRRILDGGFMEKGTETYREALAHYCKCLCRGSFNGYDDDDPRSFNGWQFTGMEEWMVNR